MKPGDLEQRLERQPLRQVPTEWRAEILTAAESAVALRHSPPVTRSSWLSTFNHQVSTILWPNPQAWAGLAAVWILIFAVDFSVRDKTPVVARKSAPPSPEVVAEMKQQQRLLAELFGARDTGNAGQSKPMVPRPRSECVEMLTT